MGSLMAGWDSPVLESKTDIYKRNRSLTNEEIEAYWKSNKKPDEKDIPSSPDSIIYEEKSVTVNKSGVKYQKSSSMPVERTRTDHEKYFMHGESESMDSPAHNVDSSNRNGWWTSSSWAFLNEPPTSEGASNTRYAAQFHVANSSGPRDGIST